MASITAATAVNNALAFVINVAAATQLGVERFGVFSLAISLATMIGVVGDLGLNLSMMRLFNKYGADSTRQALVLGSALSFKLFLFFVVASVSGPLVAILQRFGVLGSEAELLFVLALFSGGLLFLWSYVQAYFQAHRMFKHLSFHILFYFALRALCVVLVHRVAPGDPLGWLLAAYAIPLMVLIIASLGLQGFRLIIITFGRPREALFTLKELLVYGRWVALSAIAYTTIPNMVRFILTERASLEEVGIFSAGMTFTMAFSTLNTAVRAVLFPHVTALNTEQLQDYFRSLRKSLPYYCGVSVLGLLALGLVLVYVLGEEYRAALPVFFVSAGTLATVVFLGLATMAVHTLMRPEVDACVNFLRLGLAALSSYVLAGSFGALGTAVAYGLTLLIGEVLLVLYVLRELRKLNRDA